MKRRVRRFLDLLGISTVVTFFLLFAYIHVATFWETRNWSLLLFAGSETLTITLFLVRNKAHRVSPHAFHYVLATVGTLAGLLFRPHSGGVMWATEIITLGVCLQIAALVSLNRSFGIVPADRGIKTKGMYRFVRHPMYMSYLCMYGGYVLANPSSVNAFILVYALSVQVWRIFAEEEVLLSNPQYAEYVQKVRWRVIPYIF